MLFRLIFGRLIFEKIFTPLFALLHFSLIRETSGYFAQYKSTESTREHRLGHWPCNNRHAFAEVYAVCAASHTESLEVVRVTLLPGTGLPSRDHLHLSTHNVEWVGDGLRHQARAGAKGKHDAHWQLLQMVIRARARPAAPIVIEPAHRGHTLPAQQRSPSRTFA